MSISKKQRAKIIFFASRPIWGLIPVRIVFGSLLILHGLPKMIWVLSNGGGTVYELPGEVAATVVVVFGIIEVIGGALIIPGLFARVVGFVILIELVLSIFLQRFPLGFDGGMQFEMLMSAVAAMLLMSGAGRYSVDWSIAKKLLDKHPDKRLEAYVIADEPHKTHWYE